MAKQSDPTIQYVRQRIELDPITGRLYWRYSPCLPQRWNSRWAGKPALSSFSQGYLSGSLLNRKTYAHRVVFALYYGRWPVGEVDHIDGNRANNHPSNLREATKRQNQLNSRSRDGSTSRYRCVYRQNGKWRVQANVDGRKVHVGVFDDESEAAAAFNRFAVDNLGSRARLNVIGD